MTQTIWNNKYLTVNKKSYFHKSMSENNINYIADIVSSQNEIKTWEEIIGLKLECKSVF